MALPRTTRPLLHLAIYSQSRADTRRWQLLHHTVALTHTITSGLFVIVLYGYPSITYTTRAKEKDHISHLHAVLGWFFSVLYFNYFLDTKWISKKPFLTSSIIGPKASLSITLWPVDETSAFWTSSSFAAAAFSVDRKFNGKYKIDKYFKIGHLLTGIFANTKSKKHYTFVETCLWLKHNHTAAIWVNGGCKCVFQSKQLPCWWQSLDKLHCHVQKGYYGNTDGVKTALLQIKLLL